MDRRQYLATAGGFAALGLAGCTDQLPAGTGDAGDGPTPTGDPTTTPTDEPASGTPAMLRAGGYTVTLASPRVRPSVRVAGDHVDVMAEAATQYLVLDVKAEGTALDEVPLSAVADGTTVAERGSFVGRPRSQRDGPMAFPVPVDSYDSAAVVLDADGESDRWAAPEGIVATLGAAPTFEVESLDVPDRVSYGDSFEASFTAANRGDREARFLAEFGHGLISDVGEVELTVPLDERRTHTQRIDPPYGDRTETIPVVLDWGVARQRVEVAVEN
jgi:hypothetical protein